MWLLCLYNFDWQWSRIVCEFSTSDVGTAGWKAHRQRIEVYSPHSNSAPQFPICSDWCKHHLISTAWQWAHKMRFFYGCLPCHPASLLFGSFRCQNQPHIMHVISVCHPDCWWVSTSCRLSMATEVYSSRVELRVLRVALIHIGHIDHQVITQCYQ